MLDGVRPGFRGSATCDLHWAKALGTRVSGGTGDTLALHGEGASQAAFQRMNCRRKAAAVIGRLKR